MNRDELHIARELINETALHIFLTGKAGTGKTTFLKNLKDITRKRLVITAPTGVAAINAGGVTLHSFFQLPFGIMLPGKNGKLFAKEEVHKLNRKKRDIIRSLDLLVIDEISMVRADMLDAIDRVLRRYRMQDIPFGGVQVLMIGDLYQLPPVVTREEENLISAAYESPYFFSSRVYRESRPVRIELRHVFRQQDAGFLRILGEIRNGIINPQSKKKLDERHIPGFKTEQGDGYITLTTHNRKAERINTRRMGELPTRSYFYSADIRGNFPEHAYPTAKNLELKKGAQVMFIKNDSSYDKKYFNGKIGEVSYLDEEEIYVTCPGEEDPIQVRRETWEQISYSLNNATKEIEEKRIGSFTQFPLKPAWAITIHKSQGLTFDRVVIDTADAFSHGQTYVALSRCRSLEGIVLSDRFDTGSLITDRRVQDFYTSDDHRPTAEILYKYKRDYQLGLIRELFEFYPSVKIIELLIQTYYKHAGSLEGEFISPLEELKNLLVPLVRTGINFHKQLQQHPTDELPENDPYIQLRFRKAVSYFLPILNEKILPVFQKIEYDTDNKKLGNNIAGQLNRLDVQFTVKQHILETLSQGFEIDPYLAARAKAVLKDTKTAKRKAKPVEQPELYEELRELRMIISHSENIAPFQVFTQETLYEMCRLLPADEKQLLRIKGMGKTRVSKFGEEILEVIREYSGKHGLSPAPELLKEPKPKVGSSHNATLKLALDGLSVREIAEVRGLAVSTIEGHLAKLIRAGKIPLNKVMQADKIKEMELKIPADQIGTPLNQLREITGNAFSFGELRLYVNQKLFEKEQRKGGME